MACRFCSYSSADLASFAFPKHVRGAKTRETFRIKSELWVSHVGAGAAISNRRLVKFFRQRYTNSFEHELAIFQRLPHGVGPSFFEPVEGPLPGFIMRRLDCFKQGREYMNSYMFFPLEHPLFRALFAATSTLHSAGLIHGDLKPDNFFYDPLFNKVYFIDFDSAYDLSNPKGRVRGGSIKFTPPESLELEGIFPATDVFSIGVLLYYALYKRLPFKCTSPSCFARPSFESSDDPTEARMISVVAKSLEKDPLARFQTVEELDRAYSEAVASSIEPASKQFWFFRLPFMQP